MTNNLACYNTKLITTVKSFKVNAQQAQCYKTFYIYSSECLELARVLLPGKPFHPNLKGASKPKAYPSEAPIRRTAQGEASGLTCKHQTRLEKLARDKH